MGNGASSAGPSYPVEFYWDFRSPPSRCVHMTLMAIGNAFEEKPIDLFKGGNKAEEFLAVNPLGKVPAIRVGNFTLFESRAISCYLCNKGKTASAKLLYPENAEARAEVDKVLSLSVDISKVVFEYTKLGAVIFGGGRGPDPDKLGELEKTLAMVSSLLAKTTFIAADHLTIADFYAAIPFAMLDATTKDDFQATFYAKDEAGLVKKWLTAIRGLPYYDDVNGKALGLFTEMYFGNLAKLDAAAESTEE